MKYGLVTLTVSECKRLIALGTAALPQVRLALASGTIIVANGTTNAYVAEALGSPPLDKGCYTAGIICGGRACTTPEHSRLEPYVFRQGHITREDWRNVLEELRPGDLFVKGGNCLDGSGNIGILLGSPSGGTIGSALGHLSARGIEVVAPIGLEKLVPSVTAATSMLGINRLDFSLGMPCGLQVLSGATVVTEEVALRQLTGCTATAVAGGGAGDSQGAITLAFAGDSTAFSKALILVQKIKGEPPLAGEARDCPCKDPCHYGRPGTE